MADDKATLILLGEINGKMGSVLERLDKVEKKVDSVVAMTNRWKGATTILIFFGGLIGWATNLVIKGHV
jgi:tetrahydromethanopterin S-methyltransferase subunit G